MGKYKKGANNEDSDYESDGGTHYSPAKSLGAGRYAQSRLFRSITNKEVTVLNPVSKSGDMDEVKTKKRFFLAVYPNKQSYLSIMGEDYRLVVPYIPYKAYKQLPPIESTEQQMMIFSSAANAVKECHDKGLIILDLKLDNIFYDPNTNKSYLIDGGHSAPINTIIDPLIYQKATQDQVDQFKEDYMHIPPECWSVKSNPVLATPEMDVYALGGMMFDLIENPDPKIQALIDQCLDEDPRKRPLLNNLVNILESYCRDSCLKCISSKDLLGAIKNEEKVENPGENKNNSSFSG